MTLRASVSGRQVRRSLKTLGVTVAVAGKFGEVQLVRLGHSWFILMTSLTHLVMTPLVHSLYHCFT